MQSSIHSVLAIRHVIKFTNAYDGLAAREPGQEGGSQKLDQDGSGITTIEIGNRVT